MIAVRVSGVIVLLASQMSFSSRQSRYALFATEVGEGGGIDWARSVLWDRGCRDCFIFDGELAAVVGADTHTLGRVVPVGSVSDE